MRQTTIVFIIKQNLANNCTDSSQNHSSAALTRPAPRLVAPQHSASGARVDLPLPYPRRLECTASAREITPAPHRTAPCRVVRYPAAARARTRPYNVGSSIQLMYEISIQSWEIKQRAAFCEQNEID